MWKTGWAYLYVYVSLQSSSLHVAFLLIHLHACSIASLHILQRSSNFSEVFQNCGHWARTSVLRWYNSSYGRPGRSLESPGVHLLMTNSPNMASLASFMHRSRTFASVAPCPQRRSYCGYLNGMKRPAKLHLTLRTHYRISADFINA